LELQTDGALRTFDYDTISDVVMHISYTAREDQGDFRAEAIKNVNNQLKDAAGALQLARIFRVSQDFSAAWTTFRNPTPGSAPELILTIDPSRFAQPAFGLAVSVKSLGFLCHLPAAKDLDIEINTPPATSTSFHSMYQDDANDPDYEKLDLVPVNLALTGPSNWTFHLRETGGAAADFDPDWVDEIYVIIGYTLS
jgi:hypothetical protein